MNIVNQHNMMNKYKDIVRIIIECIFESYKF